jgi:hypothetical protein
MPEHRVIWCSSNEAIPIFVESRSNIGQDEGQINFGASPDDAMLTAIRPRSLFHGAALCQGKSSFVSWAALYQGTTSVVPKGHQERWGFSPWRSWRQSLVTLFLHHSHVETP